MYIRGHFGSSTASTSATSCAAIYQDNAASCLAEALKILQSASARDTRPRPVPIRLRLPSFRVRSSCASWRVRRASICLLVRHVAEHVARSCRRFIALPQQLPPLNRDRHARIRLLAGSAVRTIRPRRAGRQSVHSSFVASRRNDAARPKTARLTADHAEHRVLDGGHFDLAQRRLEPAAHGVVHLVRKNRARPQQLACRSVCALFSDKAASPFLLCGGGNSVAIHLQATGRVSSKHKRRHCCRRKCYTSSIGDTIRGSS